MAGKDGKLVAPYVGAWIETDSKESNLPLVCVAPYVGAWIETLTEYLTMLLYCVAPYVGAWIETSCFASRRVTLASRTLRGCVD